MYYVSTEKRELVSIKELSNDIANLVKSSILDSCYPIGSIYMSVNSTSPATLFGGTWDQLDEGRVLIGCNAAYPAGSTGGEFEHTLTVEEMPSHNHVTQQYFTRIKDVCDNMYAYAKGRCYVLNYTSSMAWTTDPSNIFKMNTAGDSQPHNNMQPYLAVYMWERIS